MKPGVQRRRAIAFSPLIVRLPWRSNSIDQSARGSDPDAGLRQRTGRQLPRFAVAFSGTAIAGLIAVAMLSPDFATVCIGAVTCTALGTVLQLAANPHRPMTSTGVLDVPFHLAHDRDVFERYRQISQALLLVGQRGDPIYREIALEQLSSLATELATIGDGTIVFEDTETWRLVYGKLLRSPGIHLYRSVSWMKTTGYWQDQPGLQSMRLNFELLHDGHITIERIVIINDELWPVASDLPVDRVHQWIAEQHSHGISIQLVRQSALASECDLIADIGIYGSRAVGVQELDEQCRTVSFTLTFDFDELTEAEDRWRRLSVYSMAYCDILDHFTLDGES